MKLVVFILRGCPAGWLGAYGNEWVGTPHLDRLAAESVVFDRHASDRPEPTAASRVWLGAGLLPALRAANVRTVLVRANHPDTDAPDWYYAGWDEVFDARPREADDSPLDALRGALPALLDQLAAAPDFLLWIETDRLLPPWDVSQEVFEAYLGAGDDEDDELPDSDADDEGEGDDEDEPSHPDASEDEDEEAAEDDSGEEEPEAAPDGPVLSTQYSAEEPVTPWSDPPTGPLDTADPAAREWLHTTFAAVVTKLDAELGDVFDQLRARGLDRSAAWLVTSDFGYPLGEHGQVGLHRPWLHEELVHLPLVLRLPDGAEACRRVSAFTQPPDLAPTLLDLFGVKPAEAPAGFSLLPLARGEAESIRPHVVSALELGPAAELAIRTDDWAFLLPVRVPGGEAREPQLFAKPDDRWEVNDLRQRNIERADELEALLRKT
jgi:arylsulfatase A-like enzyme